MMHSTMGRPLRSILFFGLALTCVCHGLVSAKPVEVKAGVVRVISKAEGQQSREGSGVIVGLETGAAYVLTASHVIEGDAEPGVSFFTRPNHTFRARVVRTEGGKDDGLAALLVEGEIPKGLTTLCIDSSIQVNGGEPVTVIGFPRSLGTPWAVTTGSIHGVKDRYITLQAPVEEGNSGGPVVLRARIVGIVVARAGISTQVVPSETIRRLLTSWTVPLCDERTPQGVSGTWRNSVNSNLSYVFDQQGTRVTLIEVSHGGNKDTVIAQGTGTLDGNRLTLSLDTVSGKVHSEMTLSDDGDSMSGRFDNLSSGESGVIILRRSPG